MTEPGGELDITDTGLESVAKLTGLVFPAGMTDYLSAELKDGKSQLDITFVMGADDVAGFLRDSGLPDPLANQRMILHSSPLWKLNPDEDLTVSGTQDDHGDVHRVVELLTNPDTGEGKVRARIVITPG